MKCPVCGKEKTGYLCPQCGFDESCNYDYLDTFAPVPDGTKSLPGRLRDIISSLETPAKKVKKPAPKKPSPYEKTTPEQTVDESDADLKKPRRAKKIIIPAAAVLVVIAMIVGLSKLSSGSDNKSTTTTAATATTANQDSTEKTVETEVGDIYKFGSYEQDNDTSNGKEDIEWIVLAKEDNKALLISKYVLDYKKYNKERTNVTWKTCTLRTWLNEDFYNTAFSSDEQSRIRTTTVTADKNPKYDTDPGNDTQDKVFLLSCTEAEKYLSSDEARMCAPTQYAKEHGVRTSEYHKTADGKESCYWWLRTPGSDSYYACGVFDSGYVSDIGYYVDGNGDGIRPALWINL